MQLERAAFQESQETMQKELQESEAEIERLQEEVERLESVEAELRELQSSKHEKTNNAEASDSHEQRVTWLSDTEEELTACV